MFNIPFDYDTEPKTKQGIEKLNLMLIFVPVLLGEKPKSYFKKLTKWLKVELKRSLTGKEKIKLAEGILRYVKSDVGTDKRMKTLEYLFKAEFLES